ncbi:MAG: helix-turn-helix domain-containing protein [Patescibacteria group bacterium]|nr:helix-turn-helix domain-containing protein [Patescibacteria group bacterium]
MDKKYLTTAELAKLLGISRIAVFKKIKSGKIKAKKIGRNFFIDRKNIGGILDGTLTEKKKNEIDEAVRKTVREYGETLKLLGKE